MIKILEDATVTIKLSDLDNMREVYRQFRDLRQKFEKCGQIQKVSNDFYLIINEEKIMGLALEITKDMHEFEDDDNIYVRLDRGQSL